MHSNVNSYKKQRTRNTNDNLFVCLIKKHHQLSSLNKFIHTKTPISIDYLSINKRKSIELVWFQCLSHFWKWYNNNHCAFSHIGVSPTKFHFNFMATNTGAGAIVAGFWLYVHIYRYLFYFNFFFQASKRKQHLSNANDKLSHIHLVSQLWCNIFYFWYLRVVARLRTTHKTNRLNLMYRFGWNQQLAVLKLKIHDSQPNTAKNPKNAR